MLIHQLKERAKLLRCLRKFFYDRDVLEVDVPVLGDATVTDVFLEPLVTSVSDQKCFLQTSPEYYMKRLLVNGSGSIFYLGKAFRQDERGLRHRPEFTMLEWYRVGIDDHALMLEVRDLLLILAPDMTVKILPYGSLFESILGCSPYLASVDQLRDLALSKTGFEGDLDSKGAWLDLLFSHCVEPTLEQGITFVYDYPEEQSALAKVTLNHQGIRVARRFEVFWNGIELANGYWELTDAQEQRRRFAADVELREKMNLSVPECDDRFLAALDNGLPQCSGVALGVDRLLMCLLEHDDIASVMTFADH